MNKTAGAEVKTQLPFYHDYSRTLVMKFHMVSNQAKLLMDCEQALAIIKKIDNVTRGIPKIIYVVGWQAEGHDTIYPAMDVVSPYIKRPQDETARDSLIWLMNEAFQYNTSVSLHINLLSTHDDGNSLWEKYIELDIMAKQSNGTLTNYGLGQMVSYTLEWNAMVPGTNKNYLQKRIDDLVAMLPPLKETHTIHIDAFHQVRTDVNKNGNDDSRWIDYRISPEQEAATQKEIIRYWLEEHGIDVTAEFDISYRVDPLIGWQPMAWHYRLNDEMNVPASINAGGNGGNARFGVNFCAEGQFKDLENLGSFQQQFCTSTLPWYFLNCHNRLADDGTTVTFSEGVLSSNPASITQHGNLIRDNDDIFIPQLWRTDHEIMAYSINGYTDKSWKLPSSWTGIKSADVYDVGVNGLSNKRNIQAMNGEITLSLSEKQAVVLQPLF